MKTASVTGFEASIATNMSISSEVRMGSYSKASPILTKSIENNINGENLLEMDQTTLKEMGVKKIGDRVRIGSQAKVFRNRESRRASRRQSNRVGVCL